MKYKLRVSKNLEQVVEWNVSTGDVREKNLDSAPSFRLLILSMSC